MSDLVLRLDNPKPCHRFGCENAKLIGEASERITELERALAILTSEEVENMALAAAERIATLESRIQAATEVYAGMEGFIPKYATEAYLFRIIEQMNNALLEKDDE